MRIFLRATACIMLFAATPAMAQDCLALGRACVAQCLGGAGSTANLNPVTAVLPAGGCTAAVFAGSLTGSAATEPQIKAATYKL